MADAPKLIVLEGISGAGKTEIHHQIAEHTNSRDMVVMRFTPTAWVYNMVNGRPQFDYRPIENALQRVVDTHVVWLQVEPDEALRRKVAANDLDRLENMVAARDWYDHYFRFETAFEQVHAVNTMHRTPQDVIDEVIRCIYKGGRNGGTV